MRIKRNNETRTLKIVSSVLHDENGKPEKIIGVDVDVTDVKQAEEKLKESRHWLEQTAKVSPDSIVIYDFVKKQPAYLNNCLGDWTGKTMEELTNMGIEGRLKLLHEDDRLKLLHFNETMNTANDDEIRTIEYRITNKDEKLMWVQNRSKIFQRNENGKVTHILSILQDVTAEVQLKEELQHRTAYAESVIDSSIDRIAVYDKDLRIIAWNKRSEIITGRRKENILGKKLFEAFPKLAQDEELVKAHKDALKGNYVSLPAKRGVYTNNYYERFYIPLKNEKGETYAIVNVMHDVSELTHRNQELSELNKTLEQKNKELEQKNEEIMNFAFVSSHDMKEPLRKVHTFSDWLLEQEMPHLSQRGQISVEKMNAAVRRMEMLIDDI